MDERAARHATFMIERTYAAAPAAVFAAWADAAIKARWFTAPSNAWRELERSLDIRVGGRELLRGVWDGGPVTTFDAIYHEVLPGERLVYSYAMYQDSTLISVSLATVTFAQDGEGTRLVFTEQGVYLDSFDDVAGRERGTAGHLDRLRGALAQAGLSGGSW